MATRTIKFYGNAYSTSGDVTVTMSYNGSTVYSGTVTTINSESPERVETQTNELFSFNSDTSVNGNIPVSISVTGGTLIFDTLYGNYCGPVVGEKGVLVVNNVDNYQDLNTNTPESDGKNNVKIDGVLQERNPANATEETGEWHYVIPAGSTLTCDYVVEADLIVE